MRIPSRSSPIFRSSNNSANGRRSAGARALSLAGLLLRCSSAGALTERAGLLLLGGGRRLPRQLCASRRDAPPLPGAFSRPFADDAAARLCIGCARRRLFIDDDGWPAQRRDPGRGQVALGRRRVWRWPGREVSTRIFAWAPRNRNVTLTSLSSVGLATSATSSTRKPFLSLSQILLPCLMKGA